MSADFCMNIRKKVFTVLLAVLFFSAIFFLPKSFAQIIKTANTEVELTPEVVSLRPGGSFWVALRMSMDPEWHVYWKNPGDSGVPPFLQWTLPEGIEVSEFSWPVPEKINIPPLTSYGYEGEVVLLARLTVSDQMETPSVVEVPAKLQFLACRIECVPGYADFNVKFYVDQGGRQINPYFSQRVGEPWKKIPPADTGLLLGVFENDQHLVIRFKNADLPGAVSEAYFFPYSAKLIDHAAAQTLKKVKGGYELFAQKSSIFEASQLAPLSGVLSLTLDNGQTLAAEISSPVTAYEPLAQEFSLAGSFDPAFWGALLFAFLGGLILNLMPCVLPVLSIKILSLVQSAKKDRAVIFKNALVYTFGILCAFWVLALGVALLKWAGQQVGWGFQFQSSGFVIFMTMLFFILGLNLIGLFEINVPLFNGGPGRKPSHGYWQSYFNGILAVVVATPCTAPFMGSALGFTLAKPAIFSFFIFTFLGLGLATPFVLISLFPALLKHVPKPGAWMFRLKQIFGVLFFLTSAWLLSILLAQKGQLAVLMTLLALCAIGILLWSQRSAQPKNRTRGIFLAVALLVIFFATVQSVAIVSKGYVRAQQKQGKIEWLEYSPQLVEDLLAQKKNVFIDFTAAWCLTCQVNERVALYDQKVVDEFKRRGVVMVKADWTNYDQKITQALERYGKNSIPFYVLYKAGGSDGPYFLPELLTPNIVLEYLDKL